MIEGNTEVRKIIMENDNSSKNDILNKLFLYAAETTPRNVSLLSFRGTKTGLVNHNKSLTPSITRRVESIFHTYRLDRSLFAHKYTQIISLNYKKNDQTLYGIFELMDLRKKVDDDIIETLDIYGQTHIRVNVVRLLDQYKKFVEDPNKEDFKFDVKYYFF